MRMSSHFERGLFAHGLKRSQPMTARQKTWSGQMLTISEKPIITTGEARKILGKDYEGLSDEHLMGIIASLSKIAGYFLDKINVPENYKVCDKMGA